MFGRADLFPEVLEIAVVLISQIVIKLFIDLFQRIQVASKIL